MIPLCQFATPECGYACRAIRLVREHSRGPVGLDARAYLIRVERRLMQFHCSAPLGIPVEAQALREAAE